MKFVFNRKLNIVVVLSCALMIMFMSTVAKAAVTPVEGIFSAANGWTLFKDDDNSGDVGAGYGGQPFDAEYLFYKLDGNELSIGLQTGYDVVDGLYSASGTDYYSGDLALSFDGDTGTAGSGYEYAIDFGLKTLDWQGDNVGTGSGHTDTAGLYGVTEWNNDMQWYIPEFGYTEMAPFAMDEGNIIANALTQNAAGLGTNSFYRIVTFDTTLVSETADGDYTVDAHWTMSCGNDSIHGSFDVEGATVPEPGTIALLGIGLAGFGGGYIRRRYKRNNGSV